MKTISHSLIHDWKGLLPESSVSVSIDYLVFESVTFLEFRFDEVLEYLLGPFRRILSDTLRHTSPLGSNLSVRYEVHVFLSA